MNIMNRVYLMYYQGCWNFFCDDKVVGYITSDKICYISFDESILKDNMTNIKIVTSQLAREINNHFQDCENWTFIITLSSKKYTFSYSKSSSVNLIKEEPVAVLSLKKLSMDT